MDRIEPLLISLFDWILRRVYHQGGVEKNNNNDISQTTPPIRRTLDLDVCEYYLKSPAIDSARIFARNIAPVCSVYLNVMVSAHVLKHFH
jgi:hypothetical protein